VSDTRAASRRIPSSNDDGAGLFSTAFGLLIFFLFLFFSLQIALAMYTRTLASSAAQEGARRIAQRAGAVNAEPDADRAAGQMLGGTLVSAHRIASDSPDYVTYRVEAHPPTVLRSSVPWLGGPVERIARVKIERRQ
jgi:Flp pilus assembly protein TadG